MSETLQIGVLEDDLNMQAYLSSVLSMAPGIEMAFCATTLAEAMAEDCSDLDLCLIDIQLPDGLGTDFVPRLKATSRSKALILTALADKTSVLTAIRSGADGYLLKDSEPHQIIRHINQAVQGETPVSGRALTHLVSALRKDPQTETLAGEPSQLSSREAEILTLFAKGLSYRETSQTLGISEHTVGAHAKSIYGKLDVNSRNEAIYEALKLRWISL